jgi:hypothetical protein
LDQLHGFGSTFNQINLIIFDFECIIFIHSYY